MTRAQSKWLTKDLGYIQVLYTRAENTDGLRLAFSFVLAVVAIVVAWASVL